ncbi:MAG: cytochrome c oxidase subunit II [Chloroflexota bacterium]
MRHFIILAVLILALTALVYFGLDTIGLLPVSASLQAVTIDWLFDIEIMAISFLFALIIVPLVYSLIVFRRKPGETGDGEYIEGHTKLEITWTLIPLLVVLGLAYLGAWSLGDTLRADPEAMEIKISAFQWGWKFKYPDYGITTTELYLPIDQQVKLVMESSDVIHSFWVPEFRVKQDIIPGQTTELRITPTILGDYKLRCAELCGTEHAYMLADVVVVSEEDLLAWVDAQKALIPDTVGPDPERGEIVVEQNGCIACHSVDGSEGRGPTWLGLFGAEVDLADGTVTLADEAFLIESILDPNATIVAGYPANAMPQFSLTEEEIADILAFIETLQE